MAPRLSRPLSSFLAFSGTATGTMNRNNASDATDRNTAIMRIICLTAILEEENPFPKVVPRYCESSFWKLIEEIRPEVPISVE